MLSLGRVAGWGPHGRLYSSLPCLCKLNRPHCVGTVPLFLHFCNSWCALSGRHVAEVLGHLNSTML